VHIVTTECQTRPPETVDIYLGFSDEARALCEQSDLMKLCCVEAAKKSKDTE